MFGSLRWSRCGKGDEQRRLYKAQLCSSCHAMRGFGGRPTSLLANYDQSLLVLVLGSLAGEPCVERRCTALPWRPVNVQRLPADLQRYVAAGNLALVDAKLRDDIDDGGRWYARIARWLLRRSTRRSMRELQRLGFPTSLPLGLPARQRAVEAQPDASFAQLAEPSCELLAEVFAHGAELAGALQHRTQLRRFGQGLAVAVYAIDALEDHDEDRRRGRFNAIVHLARRVGHGAAVAAVQRALEHAVITARQAAHTFLVGDPLAIVGSILQQLTVRAASFAEHLTGRPAAAAMRPSEAGDCDCSCGDGCCDGDACGCCGPVPCDSCCDVWCCSSERRERRRQQREAGRSASDGPFR